VSLLPAVGGILDGALLSVRGNEEFERRAFTACVFHGEAWLSALLACGTRVVGSVAGMPLSRD
jgi:hypothetical protein